MLLEGSLSTRWTVGDVWPQALESSMSEIGGMQTRGEGSLPCGLHLSLARAAPLHSATFIMLAARLLTLNGALQAQGLSPLLAPLLPALSQLQQRLSFATHGVADGSASRDGVPRFYKTVHVKEALDRVRRRAAAAASAPAAATSLPELSLAQPLLKHSLTSPKLQAGYQLMLDHRVLRTPGRHPLIVPSRALALAIAAEWEWQVGERRRQHIPLLEGCGHR